MKRILLLPATAILAALLAVAAPAGANETHYGPMPAPLSADVSKVAVETTYNPRGTASALPIGLLSTRRGDPEFPGFLEGMQQASLRLRQLPLNVAPLAAETLDAQFEELRRAGATQFLLDAPNPADAADFLKAVAFVEASIVLISSSMPNIQSVPAVVNSPLLAALRAGEEAVRQVGDTTVTVAWVSRLSDATSTTGEPTIEQQLFANFQRPFNVSAPSIRLERFSPTAATEIGAAKPAVIAFFRAEDTHALLKNVMSTHGDVPIMVVGESKVARESMEQGLLAVRVRPNYSGLLQAALSELASRSDIPPILHPTAEVAPRR